MAKNSPFDHKLVCVPVFLTLMECNGEGEKAR